MLLRRGPQNPHNPETVGWANMSDIAETDKSQPRRRRRERRMLVCLECHRRKLKCTYVKPGDVSSHKHFLREARQASPDGRTPDRNPPRSAPTGGGPGRSSGGAARSASYLLLAPCPTLRSHISGDSEASTAAIPASLEGVQDGDSVSRTASESVTQVEEAPPAKIGSTDSWRALLFNHIISLTSKAGLALPSGEFKTFNEFKSQLCQRRTLILEDTPESQASIFHEFPEREMADRLADRYFHTFGAVFLFLDQPTLRAQAQAFWEQPERAPLSECIQLLLVIALGNATIGPDSDRLPHSRILRWWHLVLTWQNVALRSSPDDLHTIQTGCLIDLMRQAYSLDIKSSWPASGLLVRNAMMAGLHRDPALMVQPHAKEQQRQRQELWYTVLELDLQHSMDKAMQPAVGLDEWDTPLPNELGSSDDTDEGASKAPSPRHVLISTVAVRTRITRFLNNLRCSTDYAEASELHGELDALADTLLRSSSTGDTQCNLGFAHGLSTVLCQRSLLALHIPFAVLRTPSYAYSYNVCLSTALSMLERIDPPLNPNQHQHHDGMVVLMRTSGSIFRTVALQAMLYLCLQMEASLKDDQPWTLAAELRDRFVAVAERYVAIAERRLTTQDFVGKAFIVPAMVLAHAKLASSGMSPEDIASCDQVLAGELTTTGFLLFRRRPDIPSS
ncbi:hypothetical protein CSUB01_12101 [Colletotrichum sublineola]|uniref:Xylanolytic transcriptional activator regulatory domain-containing protein n=1 Tax=Colletotrichum sublineola TaxID=1173701 RepID=A0A066XP24_COLSU|nr:hypothetical protein CSUB01_12101 [Colletotrichum sublineola]